MGETTYDIIDTIQGGTIYGLQHVLLSMSGNCRRLRLYTRRCLRQTAFRIESAGSLSVCHKRTGCSYDQTPQRRNADFR